VTDQTAVHTEARFDEWRFELAQGQDIQALKSRVEAAARATAQFVSFTVVGGRAVSVLVSSSSRVAFTVAAVPDDVDDADDEAVPYGDLYGA